MQQIFSNLTQGIQYARACLKQYGQVTKTNKWQGIEAPKAFFEVDNVYFRAKMPTTPIALEEQVKPDMPWAEDHFLERVLGLPLNPGDQYKNWPGYKNTEFNDRNFKPQGAFTHSYMERYFPKHANQLSDFAMKAEWAKGLGFKKPYGNAINKGIRYEYGDLTDLMTLLYSNPDTRQAYLPVWFPEDTGVKHGGRVPCTIGYHFMRKGEDLNIHYMIRACDYIRHFRNDIYLTTRLGQYMLSNFQELEDAEEGRRSGGIWYRTQLGILTMDIVHFHVFESERNLI